MLSHEYQINIQDIVYWTILCLKISFYWVPQQTHDYK